MNITVLRGGPSAERQVSLVSGKAVAQGLRDAGHQVFEADISPSNLAALDQPADVIFPVLHGEFGESGELQEILEARKLPFVGSGSKASRLGIDKAASKNAWIAAGLPTPPFQVLHQHNQNHRTISPPCAVKALNSGSSIDVFICKTETETQNACSIILQKHPSVLIEQFIQGPELTVGILEEQPLPPIRIVPKRPFFDYDAKYRDSETQHRFDTGLPPQLLAQCQEIAHAANQVIGCVDLARVDIMIDSAFNPFLLEINTLPGFTPVSLLPEAAKHAGIPFPQLVDRLAKRAAARGPR